MPIKATKTPLSADVLGVAGNIGYYLALKDKTLADLSRLTGICARTLGNKQRNPNTYTVDDLARIAKALEVPYADIAAGKKPKHKWDY